MITLSQLRVELFLTALQRTASEDGTGVDLQDSIYPGGRQMKAFLNVGAVTGTDPTLDVKIQESDALGTGYTDISGAAFTQVIASDAVEEIHFQTKKRYVRAVTTIGGTSPTFDSYCGLLHGKRIVG